MMTFDTNPVLTKEKLQQMIQEQIKREQEHVYCDPAAAQEKIIQYIKQRKNQQRIDRMINEALGR